MKKEKESTVDCEGVDDKKEFWLFYLLTINIRIKKKCKIILSSYTFKRTWQIAYWNN